MNKQRGITLIALVITIIVLLILAGITINTLVGDSGIITKAQEASFRTEMEAIEEQVRIKESFCLIEDKNITDIFTEQLTINEAEKWDLELKMEVIYWGQYEIGINRITRAYAKENWRNILESKNGDTGKIDNLYYIDKETALGKENAYLYDTRVKTIYKVPITRVGTHKFHSIEELEYRMNKKDRKIRPGTLINSETNINNVEGIGYYEPNLSGFIKENTKIIYYSLDNKSSIEETAEEYIKSGKQRVINREENDYIFYDYKNQKWANILVENKGVKSYWVWIPRYAYKIIGNETKILFIDENNKQIDGQELPVDYIVHPAFNNSKKGIWVSKYEPIQEINKEVGDFPYYIPDMTGYSPENTYLEVFDEQTKEFKETRLSDVENLTKFSRDNNWFDYENRIWANIKAVNPNSGVEAWWVWIPRYAYNITGNQTAVIFTDINDNPLEGGKLPSNYIPHPAFKDGKKGIWVSKYEPIQEITDRPRTNKVNPPNIKGYNVDNTYIECFNEKTKKFEEQKIRDILSEKSVINSQNIVEQADIDYSKIKGIWYAYDNKIWANIKTVNPNSGVEAWWVWIPRYAYNITGIETKIIFLDKEGNTLDGQLLPSNYIPHPAFNNSPEGIWASKYEPIQE